MTTPVPTRYLATISRLLFTGAVVTALALSPSAAHADPTLDEQIDTASHDLEVVVEQYNKAAEELDAVNERSEEIDNALGPLRELMAANDDNLSAIAMHYYQTGGLSQLNAMLSGHADELAERLTTLDFLAWQEDRELTGLLETQRALESERTTIAELRVEKERLEKELAEKRGTIETELSRLTTLRDGASFTYNEGRTYTLGSLPAGGDGSEAVRYAHSALGTPYQWGGSSPGGYDCSGLTSAAWSSAGVALPHNAAMQWDSVRKVDRDAVKPGDLVFYYNDIHHVGIYAGEGKIIHAPEAGQNVRVSPVDSMPVYGFGRP
ncbi:NlpC/P60 family protein [Phytomonospora sp. NPDC050363]|uniref:C40 family peptidase n=1 Tax=Phytomonospora sp. NPDC050363 TaxID=3155642 RepID=UPI0034090A21